MFEPGCFEPSRDRKGAIVALGTGPLPHGRGSEKDIVDTFHGTGVLE